MYRPLNYLLALTISLGAITAANAQTPKSLDHDAYDGWESVSALKISPDGNIISFEVKPQEGDGRLVIRNTKTGAELEVERGTGLTLPKDAKVGVLTIKAPFAATRQAKIDKKKADEMPRDTVACVDLSTLELTKLGEAKSFKAGYSSAPYVFITPYSEKSKSKDKEAGKTNSLLVYNTATATTDTLKDIYSFSVNKAGSAIAAVIRKPTSDSTSVKAVRYTDFPGGISAEVSEGKEDYVGLKFNDSGSMFIFTSTTEEEKTHGTPSYAISVSEIGKARSVQTRELVAQNAEGLPEGWVVAKNSAPAFSNGSTRLILNLREYMPAKDTTVVDFEAPALDIWVWNASELPPMSKAGRRSGSGITATVDIAGGGITVLQEDSRDRVSIPSGGDGPYAIDQITSKYADENLWGPLTIADFVKVDMTTGERSMIAERVEGYTSVSPTGRYILKFSSDDGQWYCLDVSSGIMVNLTAQTGVAFHDEEDDHPMPMGPAGRPIWSDDDAYVFIEDRYDIWRFTPDGKSVLNLTAGKGRETHVAYSIVNPTLEVNPYVYSNTFTLPNAGKVWLSAFNEDDSTNGYATVASNKSGLQSSFTDKWSFRSFAKAADAERIVYLKGNFRNPYDVHTATTAWQGEQKLSDINPQQEEYIWGDVQMVHWNAYDGTPLKGLLYTPDNLDPAGKYPMMIYFYEKNAETMYNYLSPAPSRSIINIPFYVSRGYVVFVPDIVYVPGHPGKSAVNCICAGAEAICEQFAFVDKDRMAIQGQSWGGYQVAYLVTQTDMFAAGGAGAPVGNMTSAYGGIRWESGNSRIPQYEYGQSRIGKTLWEDGGLDLYIENSPVFFADNCTTPVLIMHNDADGAVPWYQGIEFFMSLRRQGKPAWLLEYNDEAHNLVERRNCKDLSIRLQQFFDHYLKGAPMPVWMQSGIPHARKGNYFAYELPEE